MDQNNISIKKSNTSFKEKIWLSSPTMHGDERKWVDEAIQTNWVSTVGENIDVIEKKMEELTGVRYAVALSNGTAALHLAIKRAGERLYGKTGAGRGVLDGRKVFCSDMTFDATVNPVAYEDGEAVFIDSEYETWNMNPKALEKAFEIYPEVKLIVIAHLYGVPAKIDEIRSIADKHGALIIEDAAESLGASLEGKQTGSFGDIGVISFNGNKIITGSSGGMLLTNDEEEAKTIRKWSTQSREAAPWYQHEDLGYNYRISNIIAGVVRGQIPYLQEHIEAKKRIWERYRDGLKDLPVSMNPWDEKKSEPNFWLSCMLIDEEAMAYMERGNLDYRWEHESGKSSPQEILDALEADNIEGRPIWKPMHLQPIYKEHQFVTEEGAFNAAGMPGRDAGADIFRRGLCLPSDNKMTGEQQDRVIEIIKRCFE